MFARRLAMNAKKFSASRQVVKSMQPMGVFAQQQPLKMFSSFETIEQASQKLQKSLDGEIKYENENYTQLEDIETFLNESGFKFMETDNGLNMTLSKDVGDKTVEVHFEARYVILCPNTKNHHFFDWSFIILYFLGNHSLMICQSKKARRSKRAHLRTTAISLCILQMPTARRVSLSRPPAWIPKSHSTLSW